MVTCQEHGTYHFNSGNITLLTVLLPIRLLYITLTRPTMKNSEKDAGRLHLYLPCMLLHITFCTITISIMNCDYLW